MARRFAPRIGVTCMNRFARIDSQKKTIFITFEQFAQKNIASNLRFAIVQPPKAGFAKKGLQFGKPETIRENQAIRANLQIDSRESGHLRACIFNPSPYRKWLVLLNILRCTSRLECSTHTRFANQLQNRKSAEIKTVGEVLAIDREFGDNWPNKLTLKLCRGSGRIIWWILH